MVKIKKYKDEIEKEVYKQMDVYKNILNAKKLIDIKKEIVSLFCQKELTIPEAEFVLSDLKMYFKHLEQEEINKTKVRPFEHV